MVSLEIHKKDLQEKLNLYFQKNIKLITTSRI